MGRAGNSSEETLSQAQKMKQSTCLRDVLRQHPVHNAQAIRTAAKRLAELSVSLSSTHTHTHTFRYMFTSHLHMHLLQYCNQTASILKEKETKISNSVAAERPLAIHPLQPEPRCF